jgi:hypothetical protein
MLMRSAAEWRYRPILRRSDFYYRGDLLGIFG